MMSQLSAFIKTLGPYDFMLFGGAIVLFIILLLVAVLARRKLLIGLTAVLSAFGVLLLAPTYGYTKMHEMLYRHTLEIHDIRKLSFTEALVVKGTVHNESDRDIAECSISVGVYKVTGNAMLDMLYPLKPFQKGSIVTKTIPVGGKSDFKLFIEPFAYPDEFNTTIGAFCR